MKQHSQVVRNFLFFLFFLFGLSSCGSGKQYLKKPIDAVTPTINSKKVAVETNVTALFAEPMLSSSFTDSSFILKNSLNEIVSGTVNYNAETNEVVLNTTTNLALHSTYTAILTSDIKTLKGEKLTQTSWQFTTRAGTWQTSLEIGGESIGIPYIVFDNNDNASLIWSVSDGEYSSVLVKRYNQSTGWEDEEKVLTHQASQQSSSSIYFDRNGNALAFWKQQSIHPNDYEHQSVVWSSYYSTGIGWGGAKYFGSDELPKVVFDKNGNALVLGGLQCSIRCDPNTLSRRYVIGSGWSAREILDGGVFKIAYDLQGNVLALFDLYYWDDIVTTNYYDISTGWGVDTSDVSFIDGYNFSVMAPIHF